jgi:hypothetical protein
MDKDKSTPFRKYKPEAMCNICVAMIHAVVNFDMLIFSFACAHWHSNLTIQKYVTMIPVVVFLQITLFPFLCGVYG